MYVLGEFYMPEETMPPPRIESSSQLPPSELGLAHTENVSKDSSINKQRYARVQAVVETCMIIGGLLVIFLFLPRQTGGDGWIRYQNLIDVVRRTIPHARYSMVGPFFAAPLLIIGKKLGDPDDWVTAYNLILFSFSLLVMYLVLKNRIDRGLLRKFFLVLIVASMFGAHLAFFYGEVFTALCVGFGIMAVILTRFVPVGWLAIILGVVNTPATALGLILMIAKHAFNKKRLRYLLVILATGALVATEAWVRWGSPLSSGYTNDHGFKTFMPYSGLSGFSYPLFFGVLALLFSFGKGLLFFAPGLLLPVRKTLQKLRYQDLFQVHILWICFLAGEILVYGHWWAWYGGLFWGPRFLLIASLPASLALAIRLRYSKDASLLVNILTLAIFCFSLWVGINGTVYQWTTVANPICTANNFNLEMICYYTPEFSVLWLPFVSHIDITLGQVIFLLYSLLAGAYLTWPLLVQITQQMGPLLKVFCQEHIKPGIWRI
ncbi:MAG: hypothetical protein ABI234_16375 [Ktedonobacteraceae bacterium]